MLEQYFLWISPEGQIHNLENISHYDWIVSKWDELFDEPFVAEDHIRFEYSMKRGWIRIRWEHSEFNVEGTHDRVRTSFKHWYPLVRRLSKESDEIVVVYIGYIQEEGHNAEMFNLPKDRIKLLDRMKK